MMAMSSPWLTVSEAALRLDVPDWVVRDLAVLGRIQSRIVHDHRELLAAGVEEFASEFPSRRADEVAEHANGPFWTPWSEAEDPEAFADRHTPDDEGDEQ